MTTTKQLLAKWQSRGGRYWIELYAEFGTGSAAAESLLPGFSYRGESCGGFIGTVAPEVALQYAAQQAAYAPSRTPRTFYDEAVAARCCTLWQAERTTS